MLCLILAVCSQVSQFTCLSLGLLVDKMGLTKMELLGRLHELIPQNTFSTEHEVQTFGSECGEELQLQPPRGLTG